MANRKNTNRTTDPNRNLFSTEFKVPSGRSLNPKYDPINDDLINSLSCARENRRARQVFEWEIARRNSVPETA